jgi:phosphoribosylanthranilate isomerase
MIKICGITTIEDAQAAVAAGATALGFNFYPKSKRYIRPEDAAVIAASLPGGVWKVGVFVNEPPARIEQIVGSTGMDVAQLHGDEEPDALPSLARIWKALRVEPGFSLRILDRFPTVEAFLLDGPAGTEYGGSGKPFLWSVAAGCARKTILAGGLDATNVRQAIAQARPWGVDACSKLESAPGVKDHRKMVEFVQAAKAAEEWR